MISYVVEISIRVICLANLVVDAGTIEIARNHIFIAIEILDHVLAATVAGLDPSRRFSPAGQKQALRDAALARLDPALFDRPKSGFVLPIDTWARRISQWRRDTEVYAYFNNDWEGYAIRNAKRLKRLLKS